jgi:hypothetical protein
MRATDVVFPRNLGGYVLLPDGHDEITQPDRGVTIAICAVVLESTTMLLGAQFVAALLTLTLVSISSGYSRAP